MREETRKKLDRKLRLQRLKWIAAGAAACAAMGGIFFMEGLDATVENHRVHGVVAHVGPMYGAAAKAMKDGLSVDVRLDDGHVVAVNVLKKTDPHVGDEVQIAEHRHGTGRVTYTWK